MEIVAQEMVTDLPSSFGKSFIDLSGYSMAKQAARQCYSNSGLSSTDVDLLEVHDCFSCNEVNLLSFFKIFLVLIFTNNSSNTGLSFVPLLYQEKRKPFSTQLQFHFTHRKATDIY